MLLIGYIFIKLIRWDFFILDRGKERVGRSKGSMNISFFIMLLRKCGF